MPCEAFTAQDVFADVQMMVTASPFEVEVTLPAVPVDVTVLPKRIDCPAACVNATWLPPAKITLIWLPKAETVGKPIETVPAITTQPVLADTVAELVMVPQVMPPLLEAVLLWISPVTVLMNRLAVLAVVEIVPIK